MVNIRAKRPTLMGRSTIVGHLCPFPILRSVIQTGGNSDPTAHEMQRAGLCFFIFLKGGSTSHQTFYCSSCKTDTCKRFLNALSQEKVISLSLWLPWSCETFSKRIQISIGCQTVFFHGEHIATVFINIFFFKKERKLEYHCVSMWSHLGVKMVAL